MTEQNEITAQEAVVISSNGIVRHAHALLRAALVGGGKPLLAKIEPALKAGGSLTLELTMFPGGAGLRLFVTGTVDTDAVIILDGEGSLNTRGRLSDDGETVYAH